MVNYRLESFKSAYRNLQLLPLVTPEALDKFRVEYGTEVLEGLEQLLEDCSLNNNKTIFTGHRGSGKSTLLGYFCRQMENNYFVVFFSISDLIEMSDVNHVNILFAMAVKLMEEAENRGLKISSKTKQAFYQWFSQHTKTESTSIDSNLELETSGEVGSNAWFIKFFAKLKATLKANSVVREEIRTEFARRISDLVERLNDIASAIQEAYHKEVLVVIDDLDKLDLEVADRVFRDNISALFQPQFRIIYTIPMAAIRNKSLRGIIRNATNNQIRSMWATKFFPRGKDKSLSAVPLEEPVKVFEEVLYKRIPCQLIEPEVAQTLILKSGGALRELIRLASQCCQICLTQMRRTPENQDLKITSEVLEKAVTQLRIEFTGPLGENDYELLVQVHQNNTPKDGMDQAFLDLLHTLYILEYCNGDLWFAVHPIVQELLQRRGLIQAEA